MTVVSNTEDLARLAERWHDADYLTVDTEFLRDATYWPVLCLVQIATADDAFAIDPMADGMDLTPLFEVLTNPKVLKVFHAARQDMEILYHLAGAMPTPIMDTQVAAMVCGFGDQVGYERLVTEVTGSRLDKVSRFTDWTRRPLTERQLRYALDDVVYLRPVYEALVARLEENGRRHWLTDEMAILTDPNTYNINPRDAWRRLRTRSSEPRFLSILREVAAMREAEAQRRNIPRTRILKDDALLEIAAQSPQATSELDRLRAVPKGTSKSKLGDAIVTAVQTGLAVPKNQRPSLPPKPATDRALMPTVELLKVLLKYCCESAGVAQKLLASSDDLEALAADDNADTPVLSGWRYEIYGKQALDLKHGRLGLTLDGERITLLELAPRDEAPEDAKQPELDTISNP